MAITLPKASGSAHDPDAALLSKLLENARAARRSRRAKKGATGAVGLAALIAAADAAANEVEGDAPIVDEPLTVDAILASAADADDILAFARLCETNGAAQQFSRDDHDHHGADARPHEYRYVDAFDSPYGGLAAHGAHPVDDTHAAHSEPASGAHAGGASAIHVGAVGGAGAHEGHGDLVAALDAYLGEAVSSGGAAAEKVDAFLLAAHAHKHEELPAALVDIL